MATVTTGNSATFDVGIGLVVTVTTDPNTIGTVARTYVNEGNDSQTVTEAIGPPAMNSVYGPYDRTCSMTITSKVGTITYVTSGTPITGSAIIVQEEGVTTTAAATTLNFVGDNVTATDVGGVATVTITGNPVSTRFNNLARALPFIPKVNNWLSGITLSTRQKGNPYPSWLTGQSVVAGALRTREGKIHKALTNGVCGATAPSGTTTSNDDNIDWEYHGVDPYYYLGGATYAKGDYCTKYNGTTFDQIYVVTAITTGIAGGGLTGTGTAIGDGGVTWASVSVRYCDSVSGTPGGDALTFATAKDDLINTGGAGQYYYPAGYTLTWVAAGSTFSQDTTTATGTEVNFINCGATGPQAYACYDRTTGNPIENYTNPFFAALRLEYPTDAEIAAKYWTIDGQVTLSTPADDITGTGSVGLQGSGSGSAVRFRGVRIKNFHMGIQTPNGTATVVTYEDFIIEDCATGPHRTTGLTKGVAIVGTGASPSENVVARRGWISGCGEDGMYRSVGAGSMPSNWIDEDIVILHAPYVGVSSSHSDGYQMGSYPKGAITQRCIIDHSLKNAACADKPVGAAFIQDGSGTATTNTMDIKSCIFCSDTGVVNIAGGNPDFLQCLFYARVDDTTKGKAYGLNFTSPGTTVDCVSVTEGFRIGLDKEELGSAITRNSSATLLPSDANSNSKYAI
jgi:hypothetical protein